MLPSHWPANICCVPATRRHVTAFSLLPCGKHSALLPGELPASPLLAWLLPFSDARISGKQSGCNVKREAFMNHGKCMFPSRKGGDSHEFIGPVVREKHERKATRTIMTDQPASSLLLLFWGIFPISETNASSVIWSAFLILGGLPPFGFKTCPT